MYKSLTILIFVYATAHIIYPLFDHSELTNPQQVMWFLSGGLAVLFTGCINLMYQTLRVAFVQRIGIIANSAMLLFVMVLSVVIPEIHVFILAAIFLATLIVTIRTTPINACNS